MNEPGGGRFIDPTVAIAWGHSGFLRMRHRKGGQNLTGKEFSLKLSGDEVSCTNALLLLTNIMLCSKLRCQRVFKLKNTKPLRSPLCGFVTRGCVGTCNAWVCRHVHLSVGVSARASQRMYSVTPFLQQKLLNSGVVVAVVKHPCSHCRWQERHQLIYPLAHRFMSEVGDGGDCDEHCSILI